ncbi:vitelline membrane outer layer protein 1 homolog [Tiliqua scincoides]|uniref:vitelline membrane outer layer protein 1 homolog n=1 Tax=Tiliqua scincoides TaxID=71010 RepID=UPI003462C493
MQPLPVILFLLFVCFTSACDRKITSVSSNGVFSGRKNHSSISVGNGGTWGQWTWVDMCPNRTYAIGFSIKVEEYGGQFSDDTSLNGIRLYCSTNQLLDGITYTVESDSGTFGEWSNITWCPDGSFLNAFELQVEPLLGNQDETTVNNIRFRCSKGAVIETVGGRFGNYERWSEPCKKGAICGLQTRQEQYKGYFADDTALNDVLFYCCE